MMNSLTTLWHLVWKDAQTIKPLLLATAIGIVGLNLLLVVLAVLFDPIERDPVTPAIMLWILMPNLVALGAPAFMNGTEQESGSFDWLRTLPVRWQQVTAAKLIVAASGFVLTWLVASAVLAIQLRGWGVEFSGLAPAPSQVGSLEMIAPASVLYLGYFGALLLLCGFVTSYAIRSPIGSLLALVPLIAVVNGGVVMLADWWIAGQSNVAWNLQTIPVWKWVVLAIGGAVVLLALWGMQLWLGRRRLIGQDESFRPTFKPELSVVAYRPPTTSLSRPSSTGVLLWQQIRQAGGPTLAIALITALALIAILNSHRDLFASRSFAWVLAFAVPVALLGGCWLGVLVFYGDTVRRRAAFLVDRGVSPSLVWWTRLSVPGVAWLALIAVGLVSINTVVPEFDRDSTIDLLVVVVTCFALGQVVGQWMQRPTLSFFAAPVYATLSVAGVAVLYTYYPTYMLTMVLMVPLLMLLTWRMTGRWLEGRIDLGYHGRVLGYTMLAIAAPCAAVFGHRWITTPALMPQWRNEMLATPAANIQTRVDPRYVRFPYDYEFAIIKWPDLLAEFNQEISRNIEEVGELTHGDISALLIWLNQLELSAQSLPISGQQAPLIIDGVTEWLSREQALSLEADAIRVLLKWASELREDVVQGRLGFDGVAAAETCEFDAVAQLELAAEYQDPDTMAELCRLIPSAELRQQSRHQAMIEAWRDYQRTPWSYVPADSGQRRFGKGRFAGIGLSPERALLGPERQRTDRYVDRFTKTVLEQLEQGLPATAVAAGGIERRRQLREIQNALRPQWRLDRAQREGVDYWTADHERAVAALQERFPS